MGYHEKRSGSPEDGYAVGPAAEDTRHDAVFGDMDDRGPNFRNVRVRDGGANPRSGGWAPPSS